MEIRQAIIEDVDDIFSTIKKYHLNSIAQEDKLDGFVTTNMTKEKMNELILSENSVMIAKENNKIIAFVMAASWEYWSKWPIFEYMKNKLPEFYLDSVRLSEENSYQYGPVCVDKSARGSGVFEKIFYASLKLMQSKYPILTTFINKINYRSYAAHKKKYILLI